MVGIGVVLLWVVGHSLAHIQRLADSSKNLRSSDYEAQVHTLLGPPLSIGKELLYVMCWLVFKYLPRTNSDSHLIHLKSFFCTHLL